MFLICMFLTWMVVESQDPCVAYKALPRAEYRGGKCLYDSEKETCDQFTPTDWYRVEGETGDLVLQSTVPTVNACGTRFPVYTTDTLPANTGDVKNMSLCIFSATKICDSPFEIPVKKCDSFHVYNLKQLGFCEAYCFGGSSKECPPFDPCDIYNHQKVDYDPGRSSSCNAYGYSDACDETLTEKWQAFKGPSNSDYLQLPARCSGQYACGTQFPQWINETTALANGSVENTICVEDGDNCCSFTLSVLSKDCSVFTVYQQPISDLITCQRACVDDATAVCPTTTSPTTTMISSTTDEDMPSNTPDHSGSDSTLHSKWTNLTIIPITCLFWLTYRANI